MKSNQKQLWIGIGISAICIIAIFLVIEPKEIWEALKTVRVGYVVWMALGLVVFLIFRALRWQFMLNRGVSWWQVFHIQNIGYMLNMVLPFRIGDVGRAILIGNVPPATLASGISTMVVERMLDMLFIIVLLPFTLASVDTLPLWMLGSDRDTQEIVARLAGEDGHRGEFALELARKHASERDYATALGFMESYVAVTGEVSEWESSLYLYLLAKSGMVLRSKPIIDNLRALERPSIDRFLDWYEQEFDLQATAEPEAMVLGSEHASELALHPSVF